MTPDDLISAATKYYFYSFDFNGFSGPNIQRRYGQSYRVIRDVLASLISDGRGTVVFGEQLTNPHIRAFPDQPKADQLEILKSADLEQACLYPSPELLSNVVGVTDYQDRPFTRELALGAGQLEHRSFDLSVLETYRNDPRYHYDNDDIRGRICVTDEFFESGHMDNKDQIHLESFGFSYDDQRNRAVAVFLLYLSRLSPEHQQIWNSKRLNGSWDLHPDYYRNSILGDWGTGISIFNAFLEELRIINLMCGAMKRPPLFRDTFENNQPRNFSFLVRPTQEEYNNFVQTLDKMMSDNINKKFFLREIPEETEELRSDGKIKVRPKGTIQMLEDWFSVNVRPRDPEPIANMIAAFKKVRQLRQKPSHAVQKNIFDQKFVHEQRDLIDKTYGAVRLIRLVLANHSLVQDANIRIPQLLYEGRVWTK